MSANLSVITNNFKQYDIDGNKVLDKPEVAQGALKLLGNEGTASEGQALATMVLGGKDGKGLFPDFDGDQGVSTQEMKQLAGLSGGMDTFEPSDFQMAFPDRFNPEGSTANVEGLQKIAAQNEAKFADPAAIENPDSSQNQFLFSGGQPGTMQEGNRQENTMQAENPLMDSMMKIFSFLFSQTQSAG
jgi:hypothetical protein